MHATQHLDIGSMLVEDDDVGIALRFQTRDKILTHEPGAARQDDFLVIHSDIQTIENNAWQMTNDHHDQPPARRCINDWLTRRHCGHNAMGNCLG